MNGRDTELIAQLQLQPHPEGGWLTVEAPLPPLMQATFTDLGFTAAPPKPPLRSRAAPEAG